MTAGETPSYKARCPFDVLNYFLGTMDTLKRGNGTGLSTSSVDSLGRYQHTSRARNGTAFLPVRGANVFVGVGLMSLTHGLSFLLANSPIFIALQHRHLLGFAEPRVSPGFMAPSKAPSSWSGSLVPPVSIPGREVRAHPRFKGAVGLGGVFAPWFGR